VDFPFRWYRLLVEGSETEPVPYRPGVYGRNLIPDLWTTLADARQARAGGASLWRFAAGRLSEFGRIFAGREMLDVLVWDDPAPGLRELRGFLGELAGKLTRKLPRAASLRQELARRSLRRALGQARAGSGAGPVRLLFVCQGNICRSPFAAAALQALLPPDGKVTVDSFGMMPRPGRPTPDFGLAAAATHGIDLRAHRSAHLSREAAEAATAILVFDETNRHAVAERYPTLRAPVLMLGDFASPPEGDIQDPVDDDGAVFAGCYAVIARSVEGVAKVVGRS
jgi:protein-tyrosine-phosphatase